MNMIKFIIYTRYPSLNEYTSANRSNKYKGSSMKRSCQHEAYLAIRQAKLKPIGKYPIRLKITWYEPNKRRDIDNIVYAVKWIADSLVEAKIIPDDSQKYIVGIENHVLVDSNNPRIEVELIER